MFAPRSIVAVLAVALLSLTGCQNDLGGQVRDLRPASEAPAEPPKPEPFEIGLAAMNRRTPVIMYHDIKERRGRDTVWFDCTIDEFIEQMDAIAEKGWTPISVGQLHAHLTRGEAIPEKSIVLTFDDNYQGFYDLAYPVLKERGWPASISVHTGFVGRTDGSHPKMTWETLRELSQDPLITLTSHTINHLKLDTLDREQQRQELEDSKKELESELGIQVDYLVYPEGKFNTDTLELAKEVGYKMAMTITNGPAETSPGILQVQRTIHTRFEKALEEAERSLASAPGTTRMKYQTGPVFFEEFDAGRFKLVMIKGGNPMSVVSETRESVSEFLERTPGTVAGINGTFFNMAAIVATDNKLVGPSITPDLGALIPDEEVYRYPKLINRPLIFWNDQEVTVTPFVAERFNNPEYVASLKEGITNLFLGGAWLVHNGVAFEEEALRAYSSSDVMDWRRRAAFGVLTDGRFFAAAAKESVSSERFAEGLVLAGAQEAILLDSGFSTSLVFNQKVLASGHSTKEKPSRPVPHAILFQGEMDPDSVEIAEKTEPTTTTSSRRRRR